MIKIRQIDYINPVDLCKKLNAVSFFFFVIFIDKDDDHY